MHLNTENETNRVNPTEMAWFRTAMQDCEGPCWETTAQGIVTYAKLALGVNLNQERKALRAERAHLAKHAQLVGSTAEQRYNLHA